MELCNILRELAYRVRTHRSVPGNALSHGMILMFHRIVEDMIEYQYPSIAQLHVTVGHLEYLITGLREQGYEIISLDELCQRLNSNRKNDKFVVFTFDDAYRDTYELAFPLFKKHDAPFTVYVPTAVPDNNFIWWYYMLDDLVYRHAAIDISIMGEKLHFELTTDEQKADTYKVLEGIFNSIRPEQRIDVMKGLFFGYALDPEVYNRKLSMTWEQLAELSGSGLATIGGHSVNHNNLAAMSRDEAIDEILRGRKRIEEKLGIKVEHFCYPFGSKAAAHFREFDLTKGLGFKTAVTSRHGYISPAHKHYLERLPRIMVDMSISIKSLNRKGTT